MMKKLVAVLIIAAMIFCIAGVMAEGGGGDGGGSDASSGGSDAGSGRPDDISGSDHSASSGKDAAEVQKEQAAEVEIEHGLSTITDHENRQRDALNAEHAAQAGDANRQSRDSAEVASGSLTELLSVSAPGASQLAAQAKTIDDSLSHFTVDENAIKTRNVIFTAIFGGDMSAADDIVSHVNEDLAALDAMDNVMNDPTTNPVLKVFTQQRVATIRGELERLKSVAENERQKKGIFGNLFGKK